MLIFINNYVFIYFYFAEIYFTNFSVDRQQQLSIHVTCFPSFPRWNWSLCFTNDTVTESYLIQNKCTDDHNKTAETEKHVIQIIIILFIEFCGISCIIVCVIVPSRSLRDTIWITEREKNCTGYDAFIVYADRDTEWVLENAPKLERKYKLKFCIPDRDFLPGELIVRSIFESIQKSKRIIVLVSENFIEDGWSHFIMDVAQCLIIEKSLKNGLLVCRFKEDLESSKTFPYRLWKVIGHDKTTGSESSSVWENVAKLLVNDPETAYSCFTSFKQGFI